MHFFARENDKHYDNFKSFVFFIQTVMSFNASANKNKTLVHIETYVGEG